MDLQKLSIDVSRKTLLASCHRSHWAPDAAAWGRSECIYPNGAIDTSAHHPPLVGRQAEDCARVIAECPHGGLRAAEIPKLNRLVVAATDNAPILARDSHDWLCVPTECEARATSAVEVPKLHGVVSAASDHALVLDALDCVNHLLMSPQLGRDLARLDIPDLGVPKMATRGDLGAHAVPSEPRHAVQTISIAGIQISEVLARCSIPDSNRGIVASADYYALSHGEAAYPVGVST
mmetsp:Transcript_3990/g.15405  ORF Transcript_3990/g.15405 Transcript_3990/m.15405 type:complete len:235 (-) Transcript_3990:1458-2162(-)